MASLLPIRMVFFGLFLLAVVSMAFALFLQHGMALEPCPPCITQRAFVILVGLFALLAALHNPRGWGRRIYAFLCLAAAVTGGAVAARHVWLQSLPEDLAPACGPSLEYMLDTLPLSETFEVAMMGDGNCAEVLWTFLGLSIPQQTLLLFIALGAVCVFQLVRKTP